MTIMEAWSYLGMGSSAWTAVILLATVLGLAIFYNEIEDMGFSERWWHMGKLQRLGYTGPPKHLFFGNMKSIIQINKDFKFGWKKLIDTYGSQVGNKKGKCMALYQGRIPVIVVTNPDVIKYVGIKNFDNFRNRPFSEFRRSKNLLGLRDDRWRAVRHTLTPTFSQAKMKLMSAAINHTISTTMSIVDEHVKDNKPVDIYGLYHGLTLEVIAKCALAINVDSQKNPDHPLLEMCKDAFRGFRTDTLMRILMLGFPSTMLFLRNILGRNIFQKFGSAISSKSLAKNVEAVIEDRKNSKQVAKTVDALQLMLEAAQLVGSEDDHTSKDSYGKNGHANGMNENANANDHMINGNASKGYTNGSISKDTKLGSSAKMESKMSEEEVADNAVVFLLAGYETTSTMLSFTSYLLAMNQDVQEKLYEEIVSHVTEEDEVNYDLVSQMQYLDMVINESLRFFPPIAATLSRQVEKDCEYEGLKFPADSWVSFPISYMHYNEELWPNPNVFDPERFHPDKKKDIHVASFLPFGLGPRNCIGMRFALMEGKMALVRLLQKYRLEPCNLTEKDIETKGSSVSLTPVSGHIYLSCVPR